MDGNSIENVHMIMSLEMEFLDKDHIKNQLENIQNYFLLEHKY
jgi:hypothetical protein